MVTDGDEITYVIRTYFELSLEGRYVERDIEQDKEMCEKILANRPNPAVVDGNHLAPRESEYTDILGCAEALKYYISRTEHRERVVEAAFDSVWRVLRCCPSVAPETCRRNARDCEKCFRGYLEEKAKKGEK